MRACPLGKLKPLTVANSGSLGRGRPKMFLRTNIRESPPKDTTGTVIEYQRCRLMKRKYPINNRFMGIKNVCVPRKVKNSIVSVRNSLINGLMKSKTAKSNSSFFCQNILRARKTKTKKESTNNNSITINSTDNNVNVAQNFLAVFFTNLLIHSNIRCQAVKYVMNLFRKTLPLRLQLICQLCGEVNKGCLLYIRQNIGDDIRHPGF